MDAAQKKLSVEPAPTQPKAKRKLVSIAEKQKPERIRVELNVEKWPALWRPAKSKGAPKVRTHEREFTTAEGIRGLSKLEVGFTQFGTITTEDQKMFYALIRQWEENGKPADRPVFFSDRLLSRLLHKKGWGSNVIEAITASLRRLRTTPLRWINSYHRNDGTTKSVEEETLFNFLEQLKIITRREHGHVTNQQGYFQFGRDILQNLLNNYSKPLLDEEFFKLQTEIGQLLYTHVDLIMSDKTRYERCTKDLFTDLGLLIPENPSYRYASNRKQALQKPITELTGKRLSTGELKSITIERSKEGKDYKVVFIKGKVTPLEAPPEAVVVNHYNQPKDEQAAQAEQLVAYFHQRFHGVVHTEPLVKELAQASALIAKYGFDPAQHIVDYTLAKAHETQFHIQHFGALLNYAARAVATFESDQAKKKRERADSAQTEALQQQRQTAEAAEEADRQKLDSQIAALPDPARQALLEQAKTELLASYPGMAVFFKANPDNAINDGAVRVRMRQLFSQGWNTHQTINPPSGQAAALLEFSAQPAITEAISPQQTVAIQPQSETGHEPAGDIPFDLQAILSRPLLPACAELAPAQTVPETIDDPERK